MTERPGRRRALIAAAMPFVPWWLAGCRGDAPALRGIDITGATYARDFSLPDSEGRTRTLADFRGKVVMLFFGFTQCPDVCPTALSRAAEVRRMLGADADRVQVIFITIDPERDTPAMLKTYTQAFDPSFLGLAGNLDATAATAKEFRAVYRKVPTGSSYTMDHSAFTYVFDAQGRIRLALRHDQTAPDYTHDIRLLLQSSTNPVPQEKT